MALLWSLIWQHRVEKLLLTRPKLLLQQVFNWHQIPAYFCSSQIILFLLSPNNSPLRGHLFHYVISSVSLSQEKICFATPVASERTRRMKNVKNRGVQDLSFPEGDGLPMAHPGAAGCPLAAQTPFLQGIQNGSRTWANNLVLLSVFPSKRPKHVTFLSAFQGVGSSIPRLHTWLCPVYPTVSLGSDPLPSIIHSETQISLMATV